MNYRCSKIIWLIALVALCVSFMGATWNNRMNQAHEIAEIARDMGLSEDNPIIIEASRLWWESYNAEQIASVEEVTPWYTEDDVRIVATVIYNEAGYNCTERHMELVGAVIVNRVKHWAFPDSVTEVVAQPGQYSVYYTYANSRYTMNAMASDRWELCKELAVKALNGEVDCPENVVFQSNYSSLGHGTYECGYTFYSTTYFNYY